MFRNYALLMLLGLVFTFSACKEDVTVPKSSAKAITKLTFPQFTPAIQATIDEATKRITAVVPPTADVTKLIPSISVSLKAKVLPDSGKVQDFTNDVTYSVTAEDGSKQDYKVMVSRTKFSGKDILTFTFADFTPVIVAKIDTVTKTITALVPASADLTKLKPTVIISDRATLTPASGIQTDFTQPVIYSVTSESGLKTDYKVTVSRIKLSAKDIIEFSFLDFSPAIIADINNVTKTIVATVPSSADLSKLKPTIKLSDRATVSPSSETTTNFSNPVKFTVTAEDATTQIYTVTISKEVPIITSDKNVIYAGSSNGVYVIDATNGKKLGILNTGKETLSPIIDNDNLYITDIKNKALIALDANDKLKKWEYKARSTPRRPTVKDGYAYMTELSSSTNLSAINIKDGTRRWIVSAGSELYATPLINNGILYVAGGYENSVFAINAASGSEKWVYKQDATINSTPMIIGSEIIGVTYRDIYILNNSDGKVKKVYNNFSDGGQLGGFTILDNVIYISGGSVYPFYAIDLATGKVKWKVQTKGEVYSDPVIDSGIVYFYNREYKLYALDIKTGDTKWTLSGVNDNVVVVEGVAYACVNGVLNALDSKTGNKKWSFSESGVTLFAPTVIDSKGIVNYDGSIRN